MSEPIILKCMEFCGGGLPECEGKCPYPTVETKQEPCSKCGQIWQGQTGEYPCELCGLPTVWDEAQYIPVEHADAEQERDRKEWLQTTDQLRHGG